MPYEKASSQTGYLYGLINSLDVGANAIEPLTPQAQGVKYVFNHIMYDANYVVQGLWDFVDHYLQTHPAAQDRARRNGFGVCTAVPALLMRHTCTRVSRAK
jgi:hypothetical protein